MMTMSSVCETRFFHSVHCCCWSSSCSSRRSTAADYFLKFGGHIFYEETGKYAITCHLETGEGAEGFTKEEANERHDSRAGTDAMIVKDSS